MSNDTLEFLVGFAWGFLGVAFLFAILFGVLMWRELRR